MALHAHQGRTTFMLSAEYPEFGADASNGAELALNA